MDIVVAGSHGLIGTELLERLRERGDTVRRLVRRPPQAAHEVFWDPDEDALDPHALEGADAVVNFAGAGVGDHRWTTEYKRTILESRTRTAGLLARTLAHLDAPPPVLLQGTAVGYYGDRGAEVLTETSGPGTTFLARVVTEWEAATAPAQDAGVRVAHLRTGIVLSPDGGALARMLPLLRLGVGGRLGSGTQYWSWITLRDHVSAVLHLLDADVHGPVNLTGPAPATNAEVTRALAQALHRPAALPVPSVALKVVLGEFASDVLGSQRALPRVLEASGFTFEHDDLESAARWVTSG
ncbi:TIGR01777 family oxidoreductase [Oerskovia enterophila]|uniref:Epimerase family protein n=1 Tax=Oerskovia enterophila TaxID=43678 RepID=A0A163TA36_9CELL|nr:TIGR01777 family oxidoreductase [Oerskovia enterophila]KZM37282.1 epimerase family protein [Oerskovia enterophila]OCI30946.1 epimerase family protein [Oerskovia enterophila]